MVVHKFGITVVHVVPILSSLKRSNQQLYTGTTVALHRTIAPKASTEVWCRSKGDANSAGRKAVTWFVGQLCAYRWCIYLLVLIFTFSCTASLRRSVHLPYTPKSLMIQHDHVQLVGTVFFCYLRLLFEMVPPCHHYNHATITRSTTFAM